MEGLHSLCQKENGVPSLRLKEAISGIVLVEWRLLKCSYGFEAVPGRGRDKFPTNPICSFLDRLHK